MLIFQHNYISFLKSNDQFILTYITKKSPPFICQRKKELPHMNNKPISPVKSKPKVILPSFINALNSYNVSLLSDNSFEFLTTYKKNKNSKHKQIISSSNIINSLYLSSNKSKSKINSVLDIHSIYYFFLINY